MEGILFDIEMFATPVTVLLGLVLLAIGACGILLGYMADEEASGKHDLLGGVPVHRCERERDAGGRREVPPGGVTPSRNRPRGIANRRNPPGWPYGRREKR